MGELKGSRSEVELKEISQEFSTFRNEVGLKKFQYPKKLKRWVVAAVQNGCPNIRVAEAAGISRDTIFRWVQESLAAADPNQTDLNSALELRLVQNSPGSVEHATAARVFRRDARIQFRSGISIDVPVESLSSAFIKMLQGADQ